MNRCIAVASAFLLVLAVVAGPVRASSAESRPGPRLRVAMLSDGGSFQDQSFNQSCREGLSELMFVGAPIFVQFVEPASPELFERKLAALAERDYRLIIGVGYRMASAIETVAAQYPRTYFAAVDGDYETPPHNVWALTFQVDQCAFPAGYLAAAWAVLKDPADPAVAWVGGADVDSVNQFVVGFRNGLRLFNRNQNQSVRLLGGHVGSFDDFIGGKQLAASFIEQGADVIFGVGSISGNGGIAAAKEAGKWAIGVDTDQYYTLINEQDILLTSCLKRMDRAVKKTVTAVLENQFWGGSRYVGTLDNHGVGLAPFHAFEDEIPGRLKKELNDIQRRLIDGTLSTGWPAEPAPN
ncbi:MAG: BMP family ABC transporter substrate-binding protein [Lentisphaerae bacterium]|nr:BMP family ABC transporter substrate-binding protein [Lentisphaerota bacterium]